MATCTSALSACLSSGTAAESPSAASLEAWRKLVQRCLSHGTWYDRLQDASATQKKEEGRKRKRGNEDTFSAATAAARAEAAGQRLCGALEWYKRKTIKGAATEGGRPRPRDDPVLSAVVDALWLAGCVLEASESEATGAAGAATGDEEGTARSAVPVLYQGLLDILRQLTVPRPWMDRAAMAARESAKKEGGAPESDRDGAVDLLEPLLPIASLQITLELPLLQAAGLLPSPPQQVSAAQARKQGGRGPPAPDGPMAATLKKVKKINTDMYYRQHKFNLLAEESEGYAKLWTFLISGLQGQEAGGRATTTARLARERPRGAGTPTRAATSVS